MIGRFFSLTICLAFFIAPIQSLAWTGKIVSVVDGDTAKVRRLDTGKQVKIRFAGIDTPEKKQAYGKAAKKFTAGLIAGKTVEIEPVTTDRYGRTVGYILCAGKEVNYEIVKAGFAWVYRRYKPKPKRRAKQYFMAEKQARESRLGLWADPRPVPPWEWRKAKRTRSQRE